MDFNLVSYSLAPRGRKILALSGGQGQNLTNYGHSTGQGTHGPVLQVKAAYSD